MLNNNTLTRAHLKTPKAAAIAGVVFSFLMLAIFLLLRSSIPADPLESGAWLSSNTKAVGLALNLVPFAGVAFLWFIGVLRDRLGQQEDRFFATVFLGSALLFLAMLFVAAALIGAVILVVIYTGIAPRWIAYVGYVLALAILIGSYYIAWSFAVLPVWVFLISLYVLLDNLRQYR
jgi:Na+/melibiose symporter-like transporter